MKKGSGKLALAYAAAFASALAAGCGTSPSAPEVHKRTSYFDVVRRFETPNKGLVDIAYAEGHIWVADEEGAGTVYKLDPGDGSVLSSVTPGYGPPGALCTDGTYLYVACAETGEVYRHALEPRLTELTHFPTGLADVRGMYFHAGNFYLFDQATRGVYEFDAGWKAGRFWRTGTAEEIIRGMTRADDRVWSADWRNGWLNRHRETGFDVDRKFCTPGWHPAGLAWDGAYLFLGDTGARRIYKLDLKLRE
ncbi:MAG TPA: hypothetical protein VMX79_08810 [bacterium]|nr:hypothetical protein [bacterium]